MTAAAADISPNHLEQASCAHCQGASSKRLFQKGAFIFWECLACRMRYVSPRLKHQQLSELYSSPSYYKSDNSATSGYVDYLSDRDNIMATFGKRFGWMQRQAGFAHKGKLLDVGCAAGFAVEYALANGWDAHGIEGSRFAADVARRSVGDRVHCGTLDTPIHDPQSFDVVLLWDVIEHLTDPGKALKQIHSLLKPGGWISVITPDCGSPLARALGRHWMEYAKPTEHIYFYSRKLLKKALENCGFEVVAGTTAGKHVGLDFLLERLSALIPPVGKLRRAIAKSRLSQFRAYINPGDKLFLLARKRASR